MVLSAVAERVVDSGWSVHAHFVFTHRGRPMKKLNGTACKQEHAMAGSLIFDLINAAVAVVALILGVIATYWQHRKVNKLSVAALSFGLVEDRDGNAPVLELTFALANTGSLPEIVTTIWLLIPTKTGGYSIQIGKRHPSGSARRESILVSAGNLVEATVYFDVDVTENTVRDAAGRIVLSICFEMVNGRGQFLARQIDGFKVMENDQGKVVGTGYPRNLSAVLLPKPASDTAEPIGV